ncbi:MAG: hypothetical protein KBT04_03680 [Bacteroidales bacterium]|nr:hypothetical protein [Candidatus Colimorpha onthohippi]
MKKAIYILSIVLIAFISCSKEEDAEPIPDQTTNIVFQHHIDLHDIDTADFCTKLESCGILDVYDVWLVRIFNNDTTRTPVSVVMDWFDTVNSTPAVVGWWFEVSTKPAYRQGDFEKLLGFEYSTSYFGTLNGKAVSQSKELKESGSITQESCEFTIELLTDAFKNIFAIADEVSLTQINGSDLRVR